MSDIVTFLIDRYDEETAAAGNAAGRYSDGSLWGPSWTYDREHFQVLTGGQSQVAAKDTGDWTGEHIARWDPARVLLEISARRKLLVIHRMVYEVWTEAIGPTDDPYLAPELMGPDTETVGGCVACHDTGCGNIAPDGPCDTLKVLASPYADRPGFRPEWRVGG